MGVIHKALDACEAELTVHRQEKENLQLKLKEEMNRNSILEQKNSSLLVSIDDAKKAEVIYYICYYLFQFSSFTILLIMYFVFIVSEVS